MSILDGLYQAIDNKHTAVLVGLDLSAAFDTICHSTLLHRLEIEFGVRDKALAWLESYLTGRKQFIRIGQHQSKTVLCDAGVPQGSVLGPLLFAAYVSPVGEIVTSAGLGFHQYADDTQIFFAMRSADIQQDLEVLRVCTDRLRYWFLTNGLMLNPDKSEAVVVGTRQQLCTVVAVQTVPVAGVNLPIASELKSLGVVIDSRLSFDKHVSAVCRSCNFHMRALSHIRHLLSTQVAHTLACSIVCSRIDYCNAVLQHAPKSTLSKLQRVQNNLARIVLSAPRRTHAPPLLYQLHWLPVESRITYKLALLTFKIRTQSTPRYLYDLLVDRCCVRSTRSSDMPQYVVPRVRTVIASRAFRVAAPTVWNALPRSVSSCKTVACFKSHLKTHLFNIAFNHMLH